MQYELLEWVATYLIHSTALLGGVWLVTTLVPRLSPNTREVSWKLALLGGFLTTAVQLGAGVQGPWGALGLPGIETSVVSKTVAEPVPKVRTDIVRHQSGELTITTVRERKVAPPPMPVSAAPPAPQRWPLVVLGLLALGSAIASIRLVTSTLALRRRLADRRDVIEDPMLESFLAMRDKTRLGSRVRLTASSKIRSPIALMHGWNGGEIVVPERAVDGLPANQQESMLAHELAHLLRRDPVWSWVAALVEAVCFFQPLNHLARRKIQEAAELQCDDWATRRAGTGMHLAKCLAEVASWLDGGSQIPPTAVTMADRGSPIVRRITRLLDDRRTSDDASPWSFGRVVAGAMTLAAAVWLVPNVEASAPAPGVVPPMAGLVAIGEGARDGVEFHDLRGEGGSQRSDVRIETPEETVRVRIERPEPRDREANLHIMIHGGWGGSLFDEGWSGWLGLELEGLEELDELEGAFDDLDEVLGEPIDIFDGFEATESPTWNEAHARAAAREAERATREAVREAHREAVRAHRDAIRAAAQAHRDAIFDL